MTETILWIAVLVSSIGAFALKLLGFVIPAKALANPRVSKIAALMPIPLLAALVAVQTMASGMELVIDARLAGLVAALIALLFRAPFLVVLAVAAVVAALLRLLGWAA